MDEQEELIFIKVEYPELLKSAEKLDKTGIVMANDNDDYLYLKIDDNFIHNLLPF